VSRRSGKRCPYRSRVIVADLWPSIVWTTLISGAWEAGKAMAKLLQGDAGDELMESLRGAARKALGDIELASFGPDTTPEGIIARGAEAVEALASWMKTSLASSTDRPSDPESARARLTRPGG
jgi:hypothetical protein